MTGNNDEVWYREKGFVSCDMQGEQVLLHLESGMYYGIGGIGTRIWGILEQPAATTRILEVIESEYDVDPALLREDVGRFLEQLAANGLIHASTQSTEKGNSTSSP